MAIITKEGYEAKTRYAQKNDQDNAEILVEAGVSRDVIDNMSHITATRHAVHCMNRLDLFNTESANFDSAWEMVNELQEFAGVSPLNEFDSPLDTDWDQVMDDENKSLHNDNLSQYFEYSGTFYSRKIEELNTSVEAKLKEFDLKYGTSYCPTGLSRNF